MEVEGEIVYFRKKLFDGFNRDDVTAYIAKLANERNDSIDAAVAAISELNKMQKQLEELQSKLEICENLIEDMRRESEETKTRLSTDALSNIPELMEAVEHKEESAPAVPAQAAPATPGQTPEHKPAPTPAHTRTVAAFVQTAEVPAKVTPAQAGPEQASVRSAQDETKSTEQQPAENIPGEKEKRNVIVIKRKKVMKWSEGNGL